MPAIQTFVTPPFEPLSAYGLAEPALTVTVWTDAAVAHTLLVGAPLKDKPELTYAKRKADDLIFTIKTELASKFGARPNDLRDRQIFHARSAEVDSVEIQAATQTVKLQREGAKWVLKSPVESAADAFEVRVFLEQLLGLSVKEFVEFPVTDMSSYGLHKPAAVVSLFGEAKRDQPAPLIGRLLIGGTDSDRKLVFVKREDEPFIYGVDAEARDKIKTDAVAFYDRAIFSFALTDFRRLTIEHDGRKATLEKTDQKWERAGDGAGEFDMGELIDTLGLIAELRAESFVADRPEALTEFGLDAPEWIITFVASRPSATGEPGAPTTHELRIAKETDANRRFAVVAGKPLIFEISKTLAARLQSLSRSLLAPADAPPVEKPAAPLPQPPPDHKE
jgi:hypothetical protein